MGARIIEAALATGAGAVHPGYGFLAENAEFAAAVAAAGLVWIGPSPRAIKTMGDKVRAREIACAAGVPVLPGSRRFAGGDLEGIEDAAKRVGFPLLVKASAGGGGIGMRRVQSADVVRAVALSTQSTADKAFGDGTVYLERFIRRARHVEVQVFGFGDAGAIHPFERDCSLQRRFQKVIEETPAPGLPAAVRGAMAKAAVELCRHQRYDGAGTVEFVFDDDSREFFFLEMNTRIQVERPVTEMATGWDIVGMQIDYALDALALPAQADVRHVGHAIECRVYAEESTKNFLPSPGRLERLRFPAASTWLRIDSGYREGDAVTPYYDALVAKVICRGNDRLDAVERMKAALAQVEIRGVRTNVGFLSACMDNTTYRAGAVTTAFIDDNKPDLLAPSAKNF